MPASGIATLALGLITQVGLPGPSQMPNYPAFRDANNQYGTQVGVPGPSQMPNHPVLHDANNQYGTQVGQPGPSEMPNFPALRDANNQYGFEGRFEQRYPFDTQQNWVHGYFQEIPAYGGHVFYRPFNYKDVLSQSQTAAGWGMSPTMPYSQQFWHRYHDQATMLKLSRTTGAPPQPVLPVSGIVPAGNWAHPAPMTHQPSWTVTPMTSSLPVPTAGHWAAPATPNFSAPVQTAPMSAVYSVTPAMPQASGPMLPPPQ